MLRLAGLIAFLILAVVLLVVLARGCASNSKHARYASYINAVRRVANGSSSVGKQLNSALAATGTKESQLEAKLKGLAAQEQQLVAQGRGINPPGPLRVENDHLIEVLQLRASALTRLADAFRQTATSKDATTAGRLIAERRRTKVDTGDLLSMLMMAVDTDETGESMNDEQVHDEVMTFIFGGHETVSSGLTWTFYLLSKHPVVARRLRQELNRVLGGRTPTMADIPQLPYLTMVIEESMRLYPPVWLISRTPIADDEIGGYHIPAGSMVLVSKYVVHRHPDFWDNPDGFDPERFTPERGKLLPPNAFLPFGTGSRTCIGKHFALMMGPLLLATLAQRVTFHLLPGQHIAADPVRHLTLRPKGEVKVTVARR